MMQGGRAKPTREKPSRGAPRGKELFSCCQGISEKRLLGLPHSIKTGDLGLLGLTTQECGNVEIVAGNLACDVANVLLYLVDDGLLFVGNGRG